MAKKQEYGNESITSLKGADRVRKRPAVIFGSDGVEGCAHSIFEIVSNSIDEARDGHGDTINVTRCKDGSVIVEDFGRGMPVDWNNGEGRFNWELLFCEMYAGGKYGEGEDNYEFSLGLNGLGLCATQYASAWMTADIYRDGYHYHLDFKKGENVGGLQKEPYKGRRTGSIIHWKPDDEVFTDIDVPGSYYKDVLRRQAVVNAGLTLNFTDEKEKDPATGKPWHESWCYQNGIADYVAEVAGEDTLTPVFSCESEAVGRDREDQPDYKVRMSAAFCFSNKVQLLEYYHNSSWLEHGGSPEHAVRTAFVYQINKYLKEKNLYKKGESAISFQDVQDCLVYVSSSFSTRTSYENQTKKAITNKFVSQAMTDFLKHYLEVYFLEKPEEAQKICQQVLVNKQSREHAEKTRQSIKKTLSTQIDLANRVLPKLSGPIIERDYGTEPETVAEKETVLEMEVSAPQFLAGFKCAPAAEGNDYMRAAILGDMASDILLGESSALYQRLYEQGLINPSFGGAFEMMPGVAYLYAGGDSKDANAVTDAILREAARIAAEGVDEDYFRRIRKASFGANLRGLNSFENIAVTLTEGYFHGYDPLRFPEVFESITPEDVAAFLKTNVTAERMVLSRIVPKQ